MTKKMTLFNFFYTFFLFLKTLGCEFRSICKIILILDMMNGINLLNDINELMAIEINQ